MALRLYDIHAKGVSGGGLVEASGPNQAAEIQLDSEDALSREYLVFVESAGKEPLEGTYTFEFSASGSNKDCIGMAMRPNDLLTSVLDDRDCDLITSDPRLNFWAPGAKVVQYTLEVTARSQISISLSSATTDMGLILMDAASRGYQSAEDPASNNAQLQTTVWPGTYRILVSSPDAGRGQFDLTATLIESDSPDCRATDLGPPGQTNGALSETDCFYGDILEHDSYRSRVDAYRMLLPVRSRLDLEMTSPDFDTLLELFRVPGLDWIESNSDIAIDNQNSSMSLVLPPGEYLALTASDFEGELGNYSITAASQALPALCGPLPIAPNVDLEDMLDLEICTSADLPTGDVFGFPALAYSIDLDQIGSLYLNMQGDLPEEEVDPWLQIYDAHWNLITSNDDVEQGFLFDAELDLDLGPGRYYVVTASSTSGEGFFRLVSEFTPAAGPIPGGLSFVYLPILKRDH